MACLLRVIDRGDLGVHSFFGFFCSVAFPLAVIFAIYVFRLSWSGPASSVPGHPYLYPAFTRSGYPQSPAHAYVY